MCGLCGMFGAADHWTEQSGGGAVQQAAERQQRMRVANAVLSVYGLRCAEWQGRFTISGTAGRSLVVDHVGALWPAAEKLAGRPIDPLDPAVIARIEALAR